MQITKNPKTQRIVYLARLNLLRDKYKQLAETNRHTIPRAQETMSRYF